MVRKIKVWLFGLLVGGITLLSGLSYLRRKRKKAAMRSATATVSRLNHKLEAKLANSARAKQAHVEAQDKLTTIIQEIEDEKRTLDQRIFDRAIRIDRLRDKLGV